MPLRIRLRALGVAAIALTLLGTVGIVHAAPAVAASNQSATAKKTVGANRVISITVNCPSTKACRGKVTASLATGGKKVLKYSVKKRSSKTLTWKLTKAQYRALTAKGTAKLKLTGKATAPTKRTYSRSITLLAVAASPTPKPTPAPTPTPHPKHRNGRPPRLTRNATGPPPNTTPARHRSISSSAPSGRTASCTRPGIPLR